MRGYTASGCRDWRPIGANNTKLPSFADRGGDEKPTQAYVKYVEESDSGASCKDVATTKVCE